MKIRINRIFLLVFTVFLGPVAANAVPTLDPLSTPFLYIKVSYLIHGLIQKETEIKGQTFQCPCSRFSFSQHPIFISMLQKKHLGCVRGVFVLAALLASCLLGYPAPLRHVHTAAQLYHGPGQTSGCYTVTKHNRQTIFMNSTLLVCLLCFVTVETLRLDTH